MPEITASVTLGVINSGIKPSKHWFRKGKEMALAIPPKIRENDIGVMSALEIDKSQCRDIIALHNNSQNIQKTGRIRSENSNIVNMKKRDVDVWVIHEEFAWVDALICTAAVSANLLYDFDLVGLVERPQLLRYKSPSEGYDWHLDIGTGDASTRKISISLALNDPNEYEGGQLSFFMTGVQSVDIPQGTAVAFPSFTPHKVEPVTKGERWSLVCWITGQPFR